jgi:hypothetical protein
MPAISMINFDDLFFHYSITENPDTSVFSLHCHDRFKVYFFIGMHLTQVKSKYTICKLLINDILVSYWF